MAFINRLKGGGDFFILDMASFEGFEPVFGEVVPERSDPGSGLLRRCLFHVYASDSFHLTVHVTDFISGAWETILSVSQLDDMVRLLSFLASPLVMNISMAWFWKQRDTVGIGGTWSEFLDYTVASLKSENVKLLLGDHSISKGRTFFQLICQI